MRNNKPQDANYWINKVIIAVKPALYKPTQAWLSKFILGVILACGPVSRWIQAAGETKRFRKFYRQVERFGVKDESVQNNSADWIIPEFSELVSGASRILLVADDTPIKRYGSRVEGAGWQYHETNGNHDGDHFYGHSLVVLSQVVEHPEWGTFSIPLQNRIYVCQKDLKKIPESNRPAFKTKLEMLAEMVQAVLPALKKTKKRIMLAFDRGYVSQSIFDAFHEMGVTIVTRFKSNINLYDLPAPPTGKRGRPPKFGKVWKLSEIVKDDKRFPIKRAEVQLYGRDIVMEYKTGILTSKISDGRAVRFVVSRIVESSLSADKSVKEQVGPWGLFASTDTKLSALDIVRIYSQRFSIEELFKDLKEVCGLGKQQVRNFSSNQATIDLTLIGYALVERWGWDQSSEFLTRHRAPWDDAHRRPSHRNKRMAMQFELLWQDFSADYAQILNPEIIQDIKTRLFQRLLCS